MVTITGDFRLKPSPDNPDKTVLENWLDLKNPKWTQRRLAEEIGRDESTISKWFADKNPQHPSWNELILLCLLTGLDVGDLITFDRNLNNKGE